MSKFTEKKIRKSKKFKNKKKLKIQSQNTFFLNLRTKPKSRFQELTRKKNRVEKKNSNCKKNTN